MVTFIVIIVIVLILIWPYLGTIFTWVLTILAAPFYFAYLAIKEKVNEFREDGKEDMPGKREDKDEKAEIRSGVKRFFVGFVAFSAMFLVISCLLTEFLDIYSPWVIYGLPIVLALALSYTFLAEED